MVKKNTKKQYIIFFIFMGILPFIFFSTSMRPWSRSWVSIIQELVYPFEYVYHASISFVKYTWNNYINLHNAALENYDLKKENALLKAKLLDYEELRNEIQRLKKSLDFYYIASTKLLSSQVISTPTIGTFYSIRISRGYLDGVKIGMPVVSADGVVGKIIRTGAKFSDVQILVDPNFNIDALLQRTRVRVLVSGSTEQDCIFYIHKNADVKIGDILITSGLTQSFPKGLPIGKVKKISYSSNNVVQMVNVEPFVEYKKLEEVFIMLIENEYLNKILEISGNKQSSELSTITEQGG